jgi:hypothetical protein
MLNLIEKWKYLFIFLQEALNDKVYLPEVYIL